VLRDHPWHVRVTHGAPVSRRVSAGWGFGLPGVYLAWIGIVVTVYPLCRWFAAVKQRRRDWWLSYL